MARRRIFLAHTHEDKLQVQKLYFDLKARGLDPWLDEVDLMPGQIWKVETAQGDPRCRCVPGVSGQSIRW